MASGAISTSVLSVPDPGLRSSGGETTPTTPRPNHRLSENQMAERGREESPSTPTRHSFGGVVGQKPLPQSPIKVPRNPFSSPARAVEGIERSSSTKHPRPGSSSSRPGDGMLMRESSHRSTQSVDSQDAEMDEDDDLSQDGSDNDSVTSDSNRPSKKKKGQRFFCTDFPPCQLSFTRSEHLARHIRKHTGERPFQCHCSRRFSRLDNLRQHAQTVHVNEEIPSDSLAATGVRFQKQIRTDRLRTPNRSRASTISSQGPHSRGHSRNLSTSSIASTASTMSIQREDSRRRPPPLAVASDSTARSRLSLDTFVPHNGSPGSGYHQPYFTNSPADVSTPTSATFSVGAGSPRFSSGMLSPVSSISRSATWSARTPSRRLSVPSGPNPFQSPSALNPAYPPPHMAALQSSTSINFGQNGSAFASPTSSVFSSDSRRESLSEAELRRRTWHPGTYSNFGQRPATSGLSYYQTPESPQPTFTNQPAANQQPMRLPGIESFDRAPPPAVAPIRRQPSPMQLDVTPTHARPQYPAGPATQSAGPGPDPRSTQVQWDHNLHQNLNRLDITTPPVRHSEWNRDGYDQNQRPGTAPHSAYYQPQPVRAPPPPQPQPQQAQHVPDRRVIVSDVPSTSRKNKRHGWYNGPLPLTQHSQTTHPTLRTSPDGSSGSEGIQTPSTSSQGDYQPAILHANGYVESRGMPVEEPQQKMPPPMQAYRFPPVAEAMHPHRPPPPIPQQVPQMQTGRQDNMDRLEALVAVATREEHVPVHRS